MFSFFFFFVYHTNGAVTHRTLVDPDRRPHGRLQVQALDVLPSLFQQTDEEVDGHLRVQEDLTLRQAAISNSHTHAQHLLQLKLDARLDLVHLHLQWRVLRDERRELASLVQARSKQTWDLLDDALRRQEGVVLLRQLLHKFLVLVELLQGVDVHAVNTNLLRLLAVRRVSENADLHLRSRDEGQLDGTAETLVLLRVIVLQANLQLNRLHELPVLLLGGGEELRDAVAKHVRTELRLKVVKRKKRERESVCVCCVEL